MPCTLVLHMPELVLVLPSSVQRVAPAPCCCCCTLVNRYVQQGLRAVNQAMGRVIRHRWDYGAVLLADERFGSQQNLRNMSRWLRDQVVTHGSFGSAIGSLTKFFKVGGAGGRSACGTLRACPHRSHSASAQGSLAAGGRQEGGGRPGCCVGRVY